MINKIDKKFLYTVMFLSLFGFLIFFSAAMEELTDKADFIKVIVKQGIVLFLGFIAMYKLTTSKKITPKYLRKISFHLFVGTFIAELLVFAPVIGKTIKGASRWVDAGIIGTIQPSEFLKIGFILFFSSLVLIFKKKLSDFWFLALFNLSLLPIFLVFFVAKDWGTMLTIFVASFTILFIQKTVKKRHYFTIVFLGIIIMGLLAYFASSHARQRIDTFLGIDNNVKAGAYQVTEGIKTIGAGGMYGRGFGKSLQKLNGAVPEPLNDSIFTIFSEEWGFLGSSVLLSIYVLLLYFGINIVKRIKDEYTVNVIIGLLIILIFPVMYNIGSVLGVLPFSGITLTFVSKGGSSLLSSLIIAGLILSFSRYRTRNKILSESLQKKGI